MSVLLYVRDIALYILEFNGFKKIINISFILELVKSPTFTLHLAVFQSSPHPEENIWLFSR